MCTDFEKQIYNLHLKEYRKAKNQPYRERKNFDKLSEDKKTVLTRLSLLFNNNRDIIISDFFKAPYEVYQDGTFFDLKFFTSQKAIKIYKIFIESKQIH